MSERSTVIRIVIVVDTMGAGGKERRLLELLKGLEKRGEVLVRLIILSDIIQYQEVHRLSIEKIQIPRKSKKSISFIPKLYRAIRNFNPDIIQSWSSLISLLILPVVIGHRAKFVNAIIANAPSVVKPFSEKWLHTKTTFPFSDAIVSNSYAGLKSYQAPPKKSYRIPNGIDLSRFEKLKDRTEMREKLGVTTTYVIGMVASFRGAKDYQTYLEAATLLLKKRSDVSFLAVGEGRDLAELTEIYQDEPKIIFPGRISDIESVVGTFNVGTLITDYRVHGEGIPNAVMEYMALGKPVIVNDAGGTTELVVDQATGLICKQRDPHDLKEKINFLLENQDVAQSMGAAGRKRIEDEFTLDNMTEQYITLYHQLHNS